MEFKELVKRVLSKGAVIKYDYTEGSATKYKIICSKDLLPYLDIPITSDAPYYDVILDTEFDIENKSSSGISYIDMPQNIHLPDLISNNEFPFNKPFLMENKHYIASIKNTLANYKAKFISHCLDLIEPYQTASESILDDLYFTRWYPAKREDMCRQELLTLIQKDITEKYFIVLETNEPILPAFIKLGLTNTALNNNNEDFVSAVKRLWYNLVITERNTAINNIENKKAELLADKNLGESDIIFYKEQYDLYAQMLNSISFDLIGKCTTVKEVITTWPAVLQPQPWYVYDY
jgi:hypothetical protein